MFWAFLLLAGFIVLEFAGLGVAMNERGGPEIQRAHFIDGIALMLFGLLLGALMCKLVFFR